jgi:putative transposase
MNQYREHLPVNRLSQDLVLSHTGYHAWPGRPSGQWEMINQQLVDQITAVYRDSLETYSSPRIFHELLALGWNGYVSLSETH